MSTEIACPACLKLLTVYPPDSVHVKCSAVDVKDSVPQIFICEACGCVVPTFWFS